MTDFPIHTQDTAPAGSQPILQTLSREIGFIPNLAATMAESPALLESFTSVRAIVRAGTLSGIEREVISLVVSFESSCSYCMASHSAFAEMEGATAELRQALRTGSDPEGEPRLGALTAFTREAVRRRGFVSDAGVASLLAAGYSRPQLLEVIAVIGMTSLANWAHNLTGATVDELFAPHLWTAPEPDSAPDQKAAVSPRPQISPGGLV